MSSILTRPSDVSPKSRPRSAAAVILVVLAAMPFGTRAAMAQIQTNPGLVVVEPRAPYQAYLAADCLPGSNFCKFVSLDVPDGQLLEIHRVACQGWHTSASLPTFVVMAEKRTSTDQFVERIDFLETTYSRADWGSVWAISEQALMFIPAAHRLRISLNSGTTGVGSYGCTISGYMLVIH